MPMSPRDTSDPNISHVSDTALWVAVYRAMESRRDDALFRDPYAERLAGARGEAIARSQEQGASGAWSVITRTAVLDEMILRAIHDGTDTVLNLAAGLDTRPYRLPLSSALRWIEVDFPDMLAYKADKLADAQPRCALERVPLDLTRRDDRRSLFERIDRESGAVLVITEGLLVYLSQDEASALTEDLSTPPHFRRWIADVLTPELLDWLRRTAFKSFASGEVQMRFAPPGGEAFFERYGWRAGTVRRVSVESRRLGREMPNAQAFRLLAAAPGVQGSEPYARFDACFLGLERA